MVGIAFSERSDTSTDAASGLAEAPQAGWRLANLDVGLSQHMTLQWAFTIIPLDLYSSEIHIAPPPYHET